MQLYARHGDLIIDKRAVTGTLKPARNLVLAGDTAAHTVMGEALFRKEGREVFLRLEKPTTLEHESRHESVALEAGDYHVYPQRERGDAEDRAVED